jgi:hypothetical protein
MRFFRFSTVYMLVGLSIGVYTAMRALETTGLENVEGAKGWQEWRLGENERSLPYALGHFLSAGQVPPSKAARYFVRRYDDEGNLLSGDCNFKVDGPEISSRWWSLRAGEEKAAIISAGQAIISEAGQFVATISPRPAPGNWLQPPKGTNFTLTYVINGPAKTKNDAPLILPTVKKVGC